MYDKEMEKLHADLQKLKINIQKFGSQVQFVGSKKQQQLWDKLNAELLVAENLYREFTGSISIATRNVVKTNLADKLVLLQDQFKKIKIKIDEK